MDDFRNSGVSARAIERAATFVLMSRRVACWMLAVAATLLITACSDGGFSPSFAFARADTAWLVGNAAAALGSDGRLALATPRQAPREIGAEAARAQAIAWARSMATAIGNLRPTLEQHHGAPISWRTLRDCDRLYYVRSSSENIPDSASPWIHNAYGPKWLVRLCEDAPSIPVVLAIAANSDLAIVDGRLRLPPFNSGSWFHSWGIALGNLPLPLEPESAIGFAFRMTGARVSDVPELIERNLGDGPASVAAPCAFWEVQLERPVRGTGTVTGDAYETDRLRVGRVACDKGDTSLFVAQATQPDTARVIVADYRRADGSVRRDTIRVPLRAPYRFEPFQVTRP